MAHESQSVTLLLDASAVDPATVAYLRSLVDALDGKCFHLACQTHIAAAGDAATTDLFRLRPNPILLTGVPGEVASAIHTLEHLLRQGSPALAAYERHAIRVSRAETEETFAAAVSDFAAVNAVFEGYYDTFDATRARLLAIRYTRQQQQTVTSQEGDQMQMMWTTVRTKVVPAFLTAGRHFLTAKGRVDAARATLGAMPDLPAGVAVDGDDDVRVIVDATVRFEESVSVLHDFMA